MSQLKLKRGLRKRLPNSLPLGEPAICLDTCELFVGQGMNKPLIKVGEEDLKLLVQKLTELDSSKVSHDELLQVKSQIDTIVTDNADNNKDNELLMLRVNTKGHTFPSANQRIDELEKTVLDLVKRVQTLEENPTLTVF